MAKFRKLSLDALEDRHTPSGTTGPVSLYAVDFDPSRSAAGDFNGDGNQDFVTATKAGEPVKLTVFYGGIPDKTETVAVFEQTYTGGARVTAGDLNGDGKDEVIVSADKGGSGRVVVLAYTQHPQIAIFPPPPATFGLNEVASIYGIEDANFRGGAAVAAADMNADGKDDLFVGAGRGGGPRVALWEGASVMAGKATRVVNDFWAMPDISFRGGVSIDAGDVNGDGVADLIVGAGKGGGQRARVISGTDIAANKGSTAAPLADFFLGGADSGDRNGVIVSFEPPLGDSKVGAFGVYGYFTDSDGKLLISGPSIFTGKGLPKAPGVVPDLDERVTVA
jgi:hypothetical protein